MTRKELTYRLHSMHGPTVYASDSLSKMLEELWRLRRSNGGLYRLVDERSGREIASIDTFATYAPLNYEENERRRAG
jgi:hypothetical protein